MGTIPKKTIVAFYPTRERHFSIDLEEAIVSLCLTENQGDIQLHEGFGSRRFPVGVIVGEAVGLFYLQDGDEGRVDVFFDWGKPNENKITHLVGNTQDRQAATEWVNAVNAFYAEIRST